MDSTDAHGPSAGSSFRFGFVAADRPLTLRDLPGWVQESFGPLDLHRHPDTRWAAASEGDAAVGLIGDPVDLNTGSADPQAISRQVAKVLSVSGLDSALRHVAYLGGRWTALLRSGDHLLVVPDFAATQSVYWHHSADGTVLASHTHLLAEVTGAEVNKPLRTLMTQARDHGAKGTIYWPGMETPFIGEFPLLPNHALHLRTGQEPQHRRFYPFPDTDLVRDPDQAYARFRDLFLEHARLLCAGRTRMGISLTAGADSRTSLAAAAPHLPADQTWTWTYMDTTVHHEGMAADAAAARQVAQHYGLPHQIVDLRQDGLQALSSPTEFGESYKRTMKLTQQFRRLSVAYHEQLPSDLTELMSLVAEVGTGFYKRRSGTPDPDRLLHLYQPTEFSQQPLIRQAFERYAEYSGLSAVQDGPIDWHDLYYQESRIGRWASLRIQEIDLAHRVLLPFNARGIVEALGGPALEDRVQKQALHRLLADLGAPAPGA